MSLIENLKKSPWFMGFSAGEIDAICMFSRFNHFKKSEWIAKEGDKTHCIYVLVSGGVDVVKQTRNGNILRLAHFSEGELFGEIGFLDYPSRTAGIIAKTDTAVIEISSQGLHVLIHDDLYFGMRFHRVLSQAVCKKLSRANDEIIAQGTRP